MVPITRGEAEEECRLFRIPGVATVLPVEHKPLLAFPLLGKNELVLFRYLLKTKLTGFANRFPIGNGRKEDMR